MRESLPSAGWAGRFTLSALAALAAGCGSSSSPSPGTTDATATPTPQEVARLKIQHVVIIMQVSNWSAQCSSDDPMSCTNALDDPLRLDVRGTPPFPYAWTDITHLLGGQRIDPATNGRPDPRPGVRESAPGLGDLFADFDFTQPPRAPLIL